MHRLAALLAVCGAVAATADLVIWHEDFSDVSDWYVVYDPGGGSSISSDGNEGSLFVNAGTSEAAFAPNPARSPFMAFNPVNAGDYTLSFTVAGLTGSTSYDVALDQFSAADGGAFIATLWQVYPASGTSVDTGFISINLGTVSGFDGATTHLLPKINMHTGDGSQTVRFDEMSFAVVPEPSAALLLLLGGCACRLRRRRR